MKTTSNPKLVVECWCECGTSCFAPVATPANQLMIDNALRVHGWTKFKASWDTEERWLCKKCSNPVSTRGVPNVGSASC